MVRVLLAFASLMASACSCGTSSDTEVPHDTGPPVGENPEDHYDRVAAELAVMREIFLDEEADELYGYGPNLFWLEFPGYDPELHSWSRSAGQTDYGFSIGSDVYNYRVSTELVLTAIEDFNACTYEVYSVGAPMDLLDTLTLEQYSSGIRWYAYAADEGTAYIVEEATDETRLLEWVPGTPPRRLWSFEELGYSLGSFQDFDVEGDDMIFLESGRIWRVDVATGQGEWLGNETQITGDINFDDQGVVWATAHEMFYYDFSTREQLSLTQAINTADYALNEAHRYAHAQIETGFARQGDKLVYEANEGIYLYDLGTGAFEPIILEERDSPVKVSWRDPVLIEDGTLFVTGLESTSGSVGAEGPVWKVEHSSLME